MKHYTKLFFAAAVAALGLASCAKEVAQVETPKDNLVTVHFGATAGIEGATKATLTTDDELTFTSAWENKDALSVKYSYYNETTEATTSDVVAASWATNHFVAEMPEGHGMWDYNVVYPAPDADSKVDFGSTRTQKGNVYNSKYDLMKGSAIEENADAGKTADGKDIVFNMTRQTAIAYFHLTSDLDEEVVSAKLSVEGNGAYLSTSDVQIGRDNSGNIDYAKGFVFKETEGAASKEINLTFTGEAPKSSDFKLWFNVLPTIYDKMTLTVETTNNTLTISRKATDMYEAGKLYKVVKKIPAEKWVKKGGGETPVVESWIATDLADITATDEVVITMAKGDKVYAMTSDKGTKDNPQAVTVTVKDGKLTETPATNLIWNIANDKGNLTIYPKGLTDKWLYSASSGTDVKVGKSTTNNIFTLDAKTKYLYNTGAKRYLGVYNSTDWRCYTSSSTNIGGQTLCFYVKGGPIDNTRPTLSVDQTSKVWAADATDAFVVNVTVNSEGGDWTVTPETLSWATVAVNKAAGTITVTPNRANETETANEAILTVAHTSVASLTAKISLKQNGKGGAITPVVLYTLTPANGKNSAYDKNCDVSIDGIVWNLTGNSQTNPWRIGGKGITKVDRALYSKTAYPNALTSIKVTFGTSNITVNSCKLVYSTNADFTDSKECNIQFKASSTVEVTDNFPANAYYKLVFNVTNTTNSNKSVQLSKIEFLGLDN